MLSVYRMLSVCKLSIPFRNPLQKYAKKPKPIVYSVLLIYRHVQNRPHPFQFVQNLFTMFKKIHLP